MANKVLCCINLDENVKLKAHALGINISAATENFLKVMIERMTTVDLLKVILTDENQMTKNFSEVESIGNQN